MGRKKLTFDENATETEKALPIRLGPYFGTACYTMDIKEQGKYVESYINDYWPCNPGEDVRKRNIRIRKNNELNAYELYALTRGMFWSAQPSLKILLTGSDGDGSGKNKNRNAQPTYLTFTKLRKRKAAGGTSYFSCSYLKDLLGVYSPDVIRFASKSDSIIPLEDYFKCFGKDEGMKLFSNKKFCDAYKLATVPQRQKLQDIAYFKMVDIVLTHPLYHSSIPEGPEYPLGFWSESRTERVEAAAELEYIKAKENYERINKNRE